MIFNVVNASLTAPGVGIQVTTAIRNASDEYCCYLQTVPEQVPPKGVAGIV
jgi:hypothetical protein